MTIMCGQPCSGKSTLSKRLSTDLGIKLISTDDVRIKMFENPIILKGNPLERYVVYYHTLKKAEEIVSAGESIMVDGTFSLKTFRIGAYYTASKLGIPLYLIECVCNNYGLINQRFEHRKRNNNLFEEWANIESFHKKFLDFEHLDREIMPDGRPVPIIHYDSEKGKAEIVYSDGSRNIEEIIKAINRPVVKNEYEKKIKPHSCAEDLSIQSTN